MLNYIANHKKIYWALIVACFVFFRLSIWTGSYLSDFWIFNYVGHDWFNGGKLYVTAWDHKAPTIFVIYGLMDKIWGTNLILTHVFTTLLAAIDTLFFYKISHAWFNYNKHLTKLSLLVYVVVRNLPFLNSDSHITESYIILFFNIALWLYIKNKANLTNKTILLIGLCFGLMFWLKVNSILLVLPITYYIFRDNFGLNTLRNLCLLILPTFLIGIMYSSYFYSMGTWRDFYIASFEYNSKYNWVGYFDFGNFRYAKLHNSVVNLIVFVPFIYPIINYFRNYSFDLIHLYVVIFGVFLLSTPLLLPYYYLPFATIFSIVTVYALISTK